VASQPVSVVRDSEDYMGRIVSDLNNVLDRLDALGLTEAGAKLASVLDWLNAHVSDEPENDQAILS
jgi:hypothetical protein